MMNRFIVRNAEVEDFEQILPLIIMAIEDLANHTTNSNDYTTISERMRAAYNTPNTRFSKEHAVVIEATDDNLGTIAGVGFAYPGRDIRLLTERTLEACQSVGATYTKAEVQRLLDSKEAEADEFYIDNLAVYEQFRGQGLSKKILTALETAGKQEGYQKISILADINNPKAKAIYEKMGYVADETYEFLGHKYYHLVKIV